MSSFLVSARKYRPVTFDSVVGQRHVTDTLKNAIKSDHLAHAFLFCGPRGVGKTTCARILAKVLNCQNPTSNIEACDQCDNCQSFNKNASFNIHELDAASNNSVEHIRALTEQVRFAPQSGRYKIYIIDEVHMLSSAAFNAFLKTLEEPPSYAVFILATTEKHKILPTILSRCQIFDFKRISIADMSGHLQHICEQEGVTAEPEALDIIAQKADGGLRDALSIFDRIVSIAGNHMRYVDVTDSLNILDYDYYFRVTEAILLEDSALVLTLFNEVLMKGFDGDLFLNGLSEHFRNLLVCKDISTLPLLEVSGNTRDRYAAQSAATPDGHLLTALALANECDIQYKTARNKRLHVEMALLRMCFISRAMQAASMPSANSVEKKTLDVSAPVPPPKSTPSVQGSGIQDNAPSLFASSSIGKVGLSLDSLTKAAAEETRRETPPLPPPTVEGVRKIVADFSETLTANQGSLLAVLKGIEIIIDDLAIRFKVPSGVGRSQLLAETKLFDQLRNGFHLDGRSLVVEIDEEKARLLAEAVEKNKPMGSKEVYAKLRELNPLVDDLQKRFDLRLDTK